MKRLLFVATLVLTTAGAPAADNEHRFTDPERWAAIWESEDRYKWQKPQEVLEVLALAPGQSVADLGAGTGYFTRLLSWQVGEQGKVYAVDIEPTMLEHINGRDDGYRIDNIITVLAEPDDPKLPLDELELVLSVNTWHHVGDRVDYIRRLEPVLRPSGRVAIIDYRRGDLPVGPPDEMKLPRAQVVAEFAEAGWTLISENRILPYQYFLVFTPGAASAEPQTTDR
jgi:SAM-dependent methyltransferase